MSSVITSAPSNIALIKYMGKIKTQGNLPTNASLSYTLDSLRTTVRLTLQTKGEKDVWAPLEGPGYEPLCLSEKGQARFLAHLQFLKTQWGVEQDFLVESANNFPSDCGLASSASSFAALTLAAGKMFQQIKPQAWGGELRALSSLSRQGSGSSCRSLYTPWALWAAESAEPVLLPYKKLLHQVIIVEASKKEVSSSDAHKLVTQSSLFPGRIERAEKRLKDLTQALKVQDWRQSFEVVWAEFWDMHALFATCAPPFMYMTSGSQRVLEEILQFWKNQGDGPLVTMDAGANVHFLWREDQKDLAQAQEKYWQSQFKVISSLT
ncbi:MAG: diphosphomevalonate/mevalonate 3,5-bisphosphate decarboxylase family protein [Pseudobdellovibrionaceae bacterium]